MGCQGAGEPVGRGYSLGTSVDDVAIGQYQEGWDCVLLMTWREDVIEWLGTGSDGWGHGWVWRFT